MDKAIISSVVRIGKRVIGLGHPAFVIAEAGVNHNGSVDRAKAMIDVAATAGADAVKFQTFRADALVSPQAPKAAYQQIGADAGENQHEMLRGLELSYEDHATLVEHAKHRSIMFLSSPFDEKSADLLAELGTPAFKTGSGELTNLPFLAYLAALGKPMIVSTGMSDLEEVRAAVRTVRGGGHADQLLLLHCVSNYPAQPADINLKAMETLREEFGVPVGYSDHTLGSAVAIASVALGACVVEKHFTMDRSLPGPDHRASLEPDELSAMISAIRSVESALGNGEKYPAASEREMRRVARKSLVAAVQIDEGAEITEQMIAAKRPGDGLPPNMLPEIVGKIAAVTVRAGQMLTKDMIR